MYLGEGISKCIALTILKMNLISNKIGDSGAKYLGERISKCVTLTTLNLNLKGNSIDHSK